MNAENFRQIVTLQLGSPSAAKTLAALFANCDIELKKLAVINGGAIAASPTNYAKIDLRNGATTLATVDSQTGFTALSGKGVSVAAANKAVPAGATLSVVYTPVGSQASAVLADALVQIEYVRSQNK